MNQKKMNLQRKANIHSDVYESCSECGRDMFRTKDIWLDRETDRYVCRHCKDVLRILINTYASIVRIGTGLML